MTPEERRMHLKRIAEGLEWIKAPPSEVNAYSAEFTNWKDRTKYSLKAIFGKTHPYAVKFANRHFWEPRVQVGPGPAVWHEFDQEAFDRDRLVVIRMLEDALEEVAFVPELLEAMDSGTGGEKKAGQPTIGVQHNYHLSDQARINYQSVDQSTNTVGVNVSELFQEIREAIEGRVLAAAEQKELLRKVDELQAAQGSGRFMEKYQAFIAAAANHMTILGPFIPPLTTLLNR